MAIYYVDNVTGNDGNAGTAIGSPKATLASAHAAASVGDTILLRTVNGANHPISSLNWNKGVNLETYYPDIATGGKAKLTGTTTFSVGTVGSNFYNISFENTITTNLNTVSVNITSKINYCDFVRNISTGGSVCLGVNVNNVTAYLVNCYLRNNNGTKFGTAFDINLSNPASVGSIVIRESFVKNFVTSFGKSSNGNITINSQGVIFKDGTNLISLPNNVENLKSFILLENNTVFNYSNAIIQNLYTSIGTYENIHVRYNYFGSAKFWSNPFVVTHFNLMNEYNAYESIFDTTSYSSSNDVVTNTPMFINTGSDNFMIEVGSPLNISSSNYIGARGPDYANSYSDPGVANVASGINYKYGSTTNNRTGTLVVPPLLAVGNVKIGVDRGDGQLGIYDGSDRWSDPGINNVAFGIVWKANSLTNNRNGNRTDANPANVLAGSGTYGALGTQFTPSLTPDYPAPANVTTDDTTNGSPGLIPKSKVMADAGGTLPLNAVKPSNGGTLDLPDRVNVADNDTIEGQVGQYKRPAQNRVSPNETYGPNGGITGSQDLPSLSSIDPMDTLEGNAGTLDLPSIDSVLLTDTLRGLPGTVRVPAPNQVELDFDYGPNDSLTGTLVAADLSNFTFINQGDVRYGLVYLYNGVQYTGTLGYRVPVPPGDVMKSLTASIKSEIEFVLNDDSFKELQYVNEVEKNAFKNNFRRYGVLAKTANEIPGPFGFITLEQGYDFILTDGFMNKPMTDEIQRERTLFLQDQCYQIYKTLQRTKCGIPDTCINVKDLIISEPQYIEKDNVIVMTSNIKVIYRQRI